MSKTDAQSLTRYVGQFIARTDYAAIPAEVIELGKKSILDGIGTALSGSVSDPGRITREYAAEFGSGRCTVIGTNIALPPRFAAFANGTAMHADDYDDTLQAATGRYQGVHVTAPVLSAVLALGEQRAASGRELLTAYHVGVEVAARIFDATHVDHILHGFHGTATCGMMGATAGVTNLLGADVEHACRALGLGASQAGGLQENIGSMTKPFHAGRSAEAAIIANELVARGFTASTAILEGSRGFYRALGGGCEEEGLRGKLGVPWSFVERGVWLKPFPSCSLTHPALTRMRELARLHDLRPEQIEHIRVRASRNICDTVCHRQPTEPLHGKFSMDFCLAAMLHEGRCGLNQFTPEFLNRPDVRATMRRIEFTPCTEQQARADHHTLVTALLDIRLMDGRELHSRIDYGKGSLADPMSFEEVEEKFRECAQYARWPREKTERVIAVTRRLETLPSVSELTASLRG